MIWANTNKSTKAQTDTINYSISFQIRVRGYSVSQIMETQYTYFCQKSGEIFREQ